MEKIPHFEMASASDHKEIVKATQLAVLKSLGALIRSMEKDFEQPGLTWEQINHIIERFQHIEPMIVIMDDEQ